LRQPVLVVVRGARDLPQPERRAVVLARGCINANERNKNRDIKPAIGTSNQGMVSRTRYAAAHNPT
jgi:hypothetical protein